MAAENFHEERLILAGYDDRVKELFRVFAEGLAQGEPERPSQDRLRRALRFAKRARNLALQAVEKAKTAETPALSSAQASWREATDINLSTQTWQKWPRQPSQT